MLITILENMFVAEKGGKETESRQKNILVTKFGIKFAIISDSNNKQALTTQPLQGLGTLGRTPVALLVEKLIYCFNDLNLQTAI